MADKGYARIDPPADVLVVGAGIAGTCAAVAAAEGGAKVLVCAASGMFSGSSFAGNTWGLGLVAPDGADDEQDLVDTILRVGGGVADEALVRSFVDGIEPAVRRLRGWGVRFREPGAGAADQREYIPCFDHKHRRWRGLEREPFRAAVGARLSELGVQTAGSRLLLDAVTDSMGAVCAGIFYDRVSDEFVLVPCTALVLATGGTASLFHRNLAGPGCTASGQAIAAQLGARLTNMEFVQFMPGLVSPVEGIVFNEKMFRFMEVVGLEGHALEPFLNERSTYGPFTTRLASHEVDLAIHHAGEAGLIMRPRFQVPAELPEFVQTYLDWLSAQSGVLATDELALALYAHASNGGIHIDPSAATGTPGLFAAGEVTGGMHGADRIGGLSSANALVFGLRAGESAAKYAGTRSYEDKWGFHPAWMGQILQDPAAADARIQSTMSRFCGIERDERGLAKAQATLTDILCQAKPAPSRVPTQDVCASRLVCLRATTALMLVRAALERSTSLGPHCRVDAAG